MVSRGRSPASKDIKPIVNRTHLGLMRITMMTMVARTPPGRARYNTRHDPTASTRGCACPCSYRLEMTHGGGDDVRESEVRVLTRCVVRGL